MLKQALQKRKLSLVIAVLIMGFLGLCVAYLQNDFHRNLLDPKIPFQIYRPPATPDYSRADSWYLNPAIAHYYADPRKVDVFFVHATSYDGGKSWLGAIDSNSAQEGVTRIQLPNYAGPFAILGNIYAPKYRQASLYTQLTLREDAIEARQFVYRDVEQAFRQFIKTRRGGRGFVLVGVEQGGLLAERLMRDVIVPDGKLRSELVAAYFLETLVPEAMYTSPGASVRACMIREETGCLVSYLSIDSGRPDKALRVLQKAVYWQGVDGLGAIGSQKALCVNPLSGTLTDEDIDARHALGATNATGLEWGTEPAVIARKVSAHCLGGLLFVDKPSTPSFKEGRTWEERLKVNSYNLFYGDLEADVQARWQAFQQTPAKP
jgi:hypothetical protein